VIAVLDLSLRLSRYSPTGAALLQLDRCYIKRRDSATRYAPL